MKDYNGELKVGMKLLYNGTPIEWCNRRTGKVNEVMNPGKYVISRFYRDYVLVKSDRKNATTEHYIPIDEIKGCIKELEFADLTCTMGFIGLNLRRPCWVINDEELIKKAKQYNKRR